MMRIRFDKMRPVGDIPDFPGYEVLRELGVGGMSRVFLARQRSLGRLVAIKLMRPAPGDDREQVEKRFLLEGRTIARLPHRNIVAIYDIVQRPDATYIAMEFLEGGTLSDRMRGGLSLAEAVAITVQLAQALQFAHDQGVIHRDLKPSNVMFRDPQTPVLTDFGIARQRDPEAMRLTQTGMLIGTPTYMSPEQIQGHEVDGRSDLYSLGVMFYELLTGQPPFRGETPVSVLMAHLTQKPPPLPEQFAAFQPVIDRCLAKDPDDRYSSMREFIRALKNIVLSSQSLMATLAADPDLTASEQLRALGFSISHPAISDIERAAEEAKRAVRANEAQALPEKPSRRPSRLLLMLLAALATVAITAAGIWYWQFERASRLPPEVLTLVERAVARADRWIAEGRLVEPNEQNALAEVLLIARLAPNYQRLAELRQRLTDALAERVRALAAVGEVKRAELFLGHLRSLGIEASLEQELSSVLATARQQEVTEKAQEQLLAEAETALAADVLDRALEAFAAARQQIPEDPRVWVGLERVARRMLKPVEEALSAQRTDAALALFEALPAALAETQTHRELAQRLAEARERRARERRLAEVLQVLREQIAERRWLEPAENSAVWTLLRAQREGLDGVPELARLTAEVVSGLQREAEAALRRGEPERALVATHYALRLKPGDRALRALDTRIENAVGLAKARALRSLEDARLAFAEGRLLSPEFESARFYLRSALLSDPSNTEAERLLRELPMRVQREAEAAISAGDFERARRLAEGVRRHYADRLSEFPFLAEIENAIEAARRRERIEQRVAGLEKLLSQEPVPIADLTARIEEDLRVLRESGGEEPASRRFRRALLLALRRVLSHDGDAVAAERLADALRRGGADDPLFLDYAVRLNMHALALSGQGGI